MLRNPVSPHIMQGVERKGSRVAKAEKSEGPERMHEDREESGHFGEYQPITYVSIEIFRYQPLFAIVIQDREPVSRRRKRGEVEVGMHFCMPVATSSHSSRRRTT
jgi:hypothetical protein